MTPLVQTKISYLSILLCLFSIHHPFLATSSNYKTSLSNGAQAYAYPINSIVIDGNSDEWPSTFKKHPIAIAPYGSLPKKKDFEALSSRA